MEVQTYIATLYSPLFYSSSEGIIIRTDKILGSTALTYALGYNLGLLKKHYYLLGEESINHNYKELRELDIFVSDGTPLNVNFTAETFRSTEYLSDRSLTVVDPQKTENTLFKRGTSPKQMGSDSAVSISKVRRYIGLKPLSTFEITVWSKEVLDDNILLNIGIGRRGELRLRKTKIAEKVCLNTYLLKEVYGFGEKSSETCMTTLFDVFSASNRKFIRGSDPRKQHFADIDLKFVNEKVIPYIFKEQ